MNIVMIIGRVTNEVEMKMTPTGKKVVNFSVAVNNKSGASFINCQAWESSAELMKQYVRKGDRLGVVGHLQTRSYESQNGKKYLTEVIVDHLDFLTSKTEQPTEEKPLETVPNDEDLPF